MVHDSEPENPSIPAPSRLYIATIGGPYERCPACEKELVLLLCWKSGQQAFHMHYLHACRDPRWGRCYESYNEDHTIVQELIELIPGLLGDVPANYTNSILYVGGKDNVAACAKHFIGDDINENNTSIDSQGLYSIHVPAYYNSIFKGFSKVIVSYSSLNGKEMHAKHDLISGFLKNTLKFVIGRELIGSPPHLMQTTLTLSKQQLMLVLIW